MSLEKEMGANEVTEYGPRHPNSTKDRHGPNFLASSGGTFLHPVTWAHEHCKTHVN